MKEPVAMPETNDKLAALREIYFRAKAETIERDIAGAIAILKSMASEEERERAAVYMEGLAEMRREWRPKR